MKKLYLFLIAITAILNTANALNIVATIDGKACSSTSDIVTTLTGDITRVQKQIILQSDLTITSNVTGNILLDLNGHTVNGNLNVTGTGNLLIDDTSDAKQGKISSTTTDYAVQGNGTLNITAGLFQGKNGSVKVEGNANISGGTFVGLLNIVGTAYLSGGTYQNGSGSKSVEVATQGKANLGDYCVFRATNHPDLVSIPRVVSYSGSVIAPLVLSNGTACYDSDELNEILGMISGQRTIKLYSDIKLEDLGLNNISLNKKANLTLDLNGHTLEGYFNLSEAALTVDDSSDDQTGCIKCDATQYAIGMTNAKAILTVNGGTIMGGSAIFAYGKITLNGGTFKKVSNSSKKYVIEKASTITLGNECIYDPYIPANKTLTEITASVEYDGSVRHPLAMVNSSKCYTLSHISALISNNEKGSVKLLSDINLGNGGSNSILFPVRSTYDLDLNGHTLKGAIESNGTLSISDNSEGRTGRVEASATADALHLDVGTVNIMGGTFVGRRAIYTYSGTVNFYGGTFCNHPESSSTDVIYAEKANLLKLGEGCYYKALDSDLGESIYNMGTNVGFAGEVIVPTPTSINANRYDSAPAKPYKTVRNGRIVIVHGDQNFSLNGVKQ